MSDDTKPAGAGRVRIAALIGGSICASVSLIMINKALMQTFEFKFVFTLTFLHLCFVATILRIVAYGGLFTLKSMPMMQNIVVVRAERASLVAQIGSKCHL